MFLLSYTTVRSLLYQQFADPTSPAFHERGSSDPEQNVGQSRLQANDITFPELCSNIRHIVLQIMEYEQYASETHCEMSDVIMRDRRVIPY
jgi:hypothetical protein